MKITKPQARLMEQVKSLLQKPTLTEDDKDFVLEHYIPPSVTNLAQFFTPQPLARELMAFVPEAGTIVDFCAGIGGLSYAISHEWNTSRRYICIELDQELVEIGKKIMPQAEWVCGNIFDRNLLDRVVPDNSFAILNPPFGRYRKAENDFHYWLKYKGELSIMAVEAALRYCQDGVAILWQNHAPFSFSGRHEYTRNHASEFDKMAKNYPGFEGVCCSIDTTFYPDFKFTKTVVELVSFGFEYGFSLEAENPVASNQLTLF